MPRRLPTIKIGDRFHELTVEAIIEKSGDRRKFLCRCDCGGTNLVASNNLRSGNTKSCGCRTVRVAIESNTTHGMTKSDKPTYRSWNSMMGRCTSQTNPNYKTYGAIGIRPCEYVAKSPKNLIALIGSRPSVKHSIDRFPDPSGGYTCGQCLDCKARNAQLNIRWATRNEQIRNKKLRNTGKSGNREITAFGRTQLLCEWAEESGIRDNTISTRIDQGGWTPEKALTTPNRKGHCLKCLKVQPT